MRRSQIALFEIAFVLLLFFGALTYFANVSYEKKSSDYQATVESFADVLYKNETFRNVIKNENLGNANLNQDWSEIEELLNNSFLNYELIVRGPPGNPNVQEVFLCNKSYGKVITQRIVSGNDTDSNNYELRRVTLGVCY